MSKKLDQARFFQVQVRVTIAIDVVTMALHTSCRDMFDRDRKTGADWQTVRQTGDTLLVESQ